MMPNLADVFRHAAAPLARAFDGLRAAARAAAHGRAHRRRRWRSASTLLVEAGTGTGKTFAYLVPALLSGRRVLISTGTRTLQDQLFNRDLPLLAGALGRPVHVALLKGRANYLCRARSAAHCAARAAAGPRASRAAGAQSRAGRARRAAATWPSSPRSAMRIRCARSSPRRATTAPAAAARSSRAATCSRRAARRSRPTSSSSITTCCWPTWR